MKLKDKKILITGGTSGIGKSMVAELIERGVTHFAILARGEDGLNKLEIQYPKIQFIMMQGDIADIETVKKVVATIEDRWGSLDILINNAGVVSAGPLQEVSDADIIKQIEVNVTGPLLLTKYSLKLLKKSKEAAILNVSSGLGLIGMPFYSVYASTKAAIRQFSDAMRRELQPFNIHVMCIYPTATDTSMMKTAKRDDMDSPEMVAKKSIEGLLDRKINVIFGGQQRLEDNRLNFESPREMDKKVAKGYENMKKSTENHRSM